MTASWSAPLNAFSGKLTALAKLPQEVAETVEDELKKQVQADFNRGKDPYGEAWTKRKKAYPWPIMRKSKTTLNSYAFNAKGKTIVARNTSPWAKYHQKGTSTLPIRMVLPEGGVLPKTWNRIISKQIRRTFKKIFK